jgi:hypothetical protein
LTSITSVLTIPHFNEIPLDDAPFHNLICYEMKAITSALLKTSRECPSEDKARQVAIRWMTQDAKDLLERAINPICVCGEKPIMDDRYVLMERRDGDGTKKELPGLKW